MSKVTKQRPKTALALLKKFVVLNRKSQVLGCSESVQHCSQHESKIERVSILTLFDLDSSSWVEESNEC